MAEESSGKKRRGVAVPPSSLATLAADVHAPLPVDVTSTLRLARPSVHVAKWTEDEARDADTPAQFAPASRVAVKGVPVNAGIYAEHAPPAPPTHFSLPGTFVTDAVARDMETLALRQHIDPSRHYKSGGKDNTPLTEQWFQLGTVVGDDSRSRQRRSTRAASLADELLAGASDKVKKRFASSNPKRRKVRRG